MPTSFSSATARTSHISRLPSSAFLKHSLTSDQVTAPKFHYLILNEKTNEGVVSFAKCLFEPAAKRILTGRWIAYAASNVDSGILLITYGMPSDSEPSTATTDGDERDPARRLLSGIMQPENSGVGELLTVLSPALKEHVLTASMRFVCDSDGNREFAFGDSEHVFVETLRIKAGFETEFAQMCREQIGGAAECTTLIKQIELEISECIMINVCQDNHETYLFTIMYSVTSERSMGAVRKTNAWKDWRRRISVYSIGVPQVQEYKRLIFCESDLDYSAESPISNLSSPTTRTGSTDTAPHHPIGPGDFVADAEMVAEEACKLLDTKLEPFRWCIRDRYTAYMETRKRLLCEFQKRGLDHSESFAEWLVNGHREFGWKISDNELILREYRPGVDSISVISAWNDWQEQRMIDLGDGIWEIRFVTDKVVRGGNSKLEYKLVIESDGNKVHRVSPWIDTVWYDTESNISNGVIDLEPDVAARRTCVQTDEMKRIYEVHVGACNEGDRIGTYQDVMDIVLPHMRRVGYNVLLLVGIQEHGCYSLGGWHVSYPYALSTKFGSRKTFKAMISKAHDMGINVYGSLIMSHLGPNADDSVCDAGYCSDQTMNEWDARTYDFTSLHTYRYLISCMNHWIEDFGLDGLRIEGVPAIIYHDHATHRGFNRYNYKTYFTASNLNYDNSAFLMIALNTIKYRHPNVVIIANDYVGTPALAYPVHMGGLGFDYTQSNHLLPAVMRYLEHSDTCEYSLSGLRFDLERMTAEKRLAILDTFDTNVIARRPMLIAFFAWESLHTIAVGGIAPHVTELAAALRRVGHEVHVFTRATNQSSATSVHYGVYYHEVPFLLDRDFVRECENMCNALVTALLAYEKEMDTRFDLIHGHDWLVARAITALKGLGRTCVFTMHSTEAGRCGNKVFGGESQRIRSCEQDGCTSADRIICVSGVLAQEVKSYYGVAGDKIRVVYNGCNVQNFACRDFDPGMVKTKLGILPLEPTVLFVGRFVIQKGVDLLVEAAPAILRARGDCKFVIVGDGHMRADVEARAKQLNVASSFRFLGAKSGGELVELFHMCDAVVIPSRNEPFGIVVLEAWSCSKPVIATTCGGPRDFVSHEVDGLLVNPEANSIAWGITKALENFDHLRWMGQQGKEKAEKMFSWDNVGEKTRDIYWELMNLCGTTYAPKRLGGCSMAQRVMGSLIHYHMAIFQPESDNKLADIRVAQLLTFSLGADAVGSFQGSEFNHPNSLDFPRPGNNFSMEFNKRLMSLAYRKDLKFKHSLLFSRCMLDVLGSLYREDDGLYVSICDEDHKILAFERYDCLFIFNLNSTKSFEGYPIGHNIGSSSRALVMLFNTDEIRFGGWGRLEKDARYPFCEPHNERLSGIKVYLPARCGMVLSGEDQRTDAFIAQMYSAGTEDIDAFIADEQ